MTLSELKRKYCSYPVKFTSGQGDLPCLQIKTELAEATIYLQGAHVTHFRPTGHDPLLFISAKSNFADGKPIRGGVPVCWPWFGAKADDPTAPMHGIARLQEWTITSISQLPRNEIGITLELLPSDLSRQYWPNNNFHLEHRIRIGGELSMSLSTRNTGKQPFTINEALHSYFAVGDVRQVAVTGLSGVTYMSKTLNMQRITENNSPITITAETDRHYLNTKSAVTIHDSSLRRKITIHKTGSKSTVVWNPWIAKARAMPDFGDEEWPAMLCVETANAADNAVAIAPAAEHEMQAIISVERVALPPTV